jgi:hypothetical protein
MVLYRLYSGRMAGRIRISLEKSKNEVLAAAELTLKGWKTVRNFLVLKEKNSWTLITKKNAIPPFPA